MKRSEAQNRTPLLDGINKLIETKPAYFRIPGHRLEKGISNRWTDSVGEKIFAYDVTETPYTDDLHQPEGVIKEAQDLLAELYEADRSFFLVNGTTCGNEAMILSSALEGQEILIARNAHKSAMMGLILSGAIPRYVMPQVIEKWGIQGGIDPQDVREAFEKYPDSKALFLVSPSYYGVTSDLRAIADICHKNGALLIVDEAHGGHTYFSDKLPKGALQQGADMCVQSFHKITGALTQSSCLHIKSKLVDINQVASNLHLVQSTSPNYLLMTSLDCARYELAQNGERMMEKAIELVAYAKEKINSILGFECMDTSVAGKNAVNELDTTRIVISAKKLGITGFELDELLFEKYAVNMELSDYENVLAVVTYANTIEDMDKLIKACEEISKDRKSTEIKVTNMSLPAIPEQILTPRQAYFAKWEEIEWKLCVGRVSAEMVAPYPPGIPVIYPGERITQEIWDYLEQFRVDNRHIHGTRDGKLEYIKVIKDL